MTTTIKTPPPTLPSSNFGPPFEVPGFDTTVRSHPVEQIVPDTPPLKEGSISSDCNDTGSGWSTIVADSTHSSKDILEEKHRNYTLPPEKKLQNGPRFLRHVVFSVYRRLFTLVWMGNLSAFIYLQCNQEDLSPRLFNIATGASANLFVATALRQDYIINTLFEACVRIPLSTPLGVRWTIAKIYEFGGIHSGAATCALLWLVYLAVYLTTLAADGQFKDVRIIAMAYVIVMMFLGIVIFALPFVRKRVHNAFERTHRFAGWITALFFWALILVLSSDLAKRSGKSMTEVLRTLPSFYLILANSVHTLLPWTPKYRLRKLPTTAEALSSRCARLHFKADIDEFYTIRISDSPLSEWHSFACFQDRSPRNGSTNSVIVAKAGDWTSKTILQPRDSYWTRGQPTRGVLYTSLMFRKVVVVTTGSGIGPCLNLLGLKGKRRPECRVLWSTPFPLETYGQEILDTVRACDKDAVIWDTKKQGRPDMLGMTWQLYKESGAEAVYVISNPANTKMVVYGMESRGVPAFGPVFDS